ncbi:phosphotransferase [Aquipuribacter sp. MA13-6]|uniref:phosphotransferase n=1 Tax=unclassified Aquipuribacter TaxID=2635084 RepID=UPI003EEFFE7C
MGRPDHDDVARLLAADPGVPGLPLLLDDDALTGWLADRLGPSAVAGGVRRRYLRWKPGAGGVARVRAGEADLFLAVWHRDGAAKLDKTVARGGRSVVLGDRDALAVLGMPAADRDLPALSRLLGPGADLPLGRLDDVDDRSRQRLRRAGGTSRQTSTLAWKPQRRWVGLTGSDGRGRVVLRAYPPDVLADVQRRYQAVARTMAGVTPAVLGRDRRRGLLAVEHLPGRGLDRFAGAEAAEPDRAAGALLASLHGAPGTQAGGGGPDGVGVLGVDAECRAVAAAAATVELLAPDAGAAALAREVVDALRALGASEPVLLHGDLSADQVVVAPSGEVGLIDLDEVVVGPACYDLAGITASWWLHDPEAAAARVSALLEGYADRRGAPGPDGLRVRLAAHLLRRAPEAFRSGRRRWPQHVRDVVRRAERALHGEALTGTDLATPRAGLVR